MVTTAHPLQRVGAVVLAVLGDLDDPAELRPERFDEVCRIMTDDLLSTADVENSKSPGGFWLRAAGMFWPNSRGLTTTNRNKMSPQERRKQIAEWRTFPDRSRWPGVPCALCGRPACGYYGKVDVPLGASVSYRNTPPRGHEGLALCFACLNSFYALPYACQIGGGRAAVLHSWDEDFLRRTTRLQISRTRKEAGLGVGSEEQPWYWREVTALRYIQRHPRRLSAGVQLIVFTHNNRDQMLEEYALDQPLAEWLRSTLHGRSQHRGYQYLVRAHRIENRPGTSMLAGNVFRHPDQVLKTAVAFLHRVSAKSTTVPGEVPDLVPLIVSYAIEVLRVNGKDIDRLRQLADNIAETLAPHRERGVLKYYESAHRDPKRLQEWLRKRAVSWALKPPEGQTGPFVTLDQWRLLFDADGRAGTHRDLLFVAVLERLYQRGWRADDVEDRQDLDDHLVDDPIEELVAEENQ